MIYEERRSFSGQEEAAVRRPRPGGINATALKEFIRRRGRDLVAVHGQRLPQVFGDLRA